MSTWKTIKKSAKPVFNDPPLLLPHGVNLTVPKVIDMTKLMQFVSPVYQQYYQDVIRNHKKIVEIYKNSRKKKNKKNTETEPEPELESDGEVEELF